MEASVATAPGQGAAAQPGALGQGQPTATDGAKGADAFWGNFPDVPEEQRPLLEPHLKTVQGYVTQLEQQLAPFKPLAEAGVDAQSAQGLLNFAQSFEADPRGTWLQLGAQLQEEGKIDPMLDLEDVGLAAEGKEAVEEEGLSGGPEPVAGGEIQQPGSAGQEDPRIAQLTQQVEQLTNLIQEDRQTRQQKVQDRLLDRNIQSMKTQLKDAGFDENLVSDETLVGQLIAHRGDPAKAVQSLTGLRQTGVQQVLEGEGSDDGNQTQSGPTMPKGPPRGRGKKATKGDPYKEANAGAEQMLRQSMRSEAAEAV